MAKYDRGGFLGLQFEVDTTIIDQRLNLLERNLPEIAARAARETQRDARELLAEIFIETMDGLSYYQFAPEFRDALLGNVATLPINVNFESGFASVDLDLDQLGTKADLKRAFHRYARLKGKNAGRLMEPYTDQELAVPDADDRHAYFEYMLAGYTEFIAKDGRKVKIPEGAWERTKAEYLKIWGKKSPQWLYLHYGQTAYEPKIPPSNLFQKFKTAFAGVADFEFDQALQRALVIAQPEEFGIRFTQTGLPQAGPEGVQIGTKFYKPGRFTPRKY